MSNQLLKVFVITLLLGIMMVIPASATERIVVQELFTNTRCHSSYQADLLCDTLYEEHSDQMVLIRYHTGFPDDEDPFYNYIPEELEVKIAYYMVGFLPQTAFDGELGENTWWLWEDMLLERFGVPADLEINLGGYYLVEERTGVLDIDIIATGPIPDGNLRLHAVAFRDSAYYEDYYGLNWHNKTVFDFLPNASGKPLSIDEGDTLTYHRAFSLPTFIPKRYTGFAVFVQDQDTKEVLQGQKIYLRNFQDAEADVDMTLPPGDYIIPPEGGTVTWQGYVKNRTEMTRDFNVWTVVEFPDGEREETLKSWEVHMEPLESQKYVEISQYVPGHAPAGDYKFYSYIGTYPDIAYAWDMFEFQKAEEPARAVGSVPESITTFNAYPNPFNATTQISFQLAEPGNVQIDIFNIRGQRIANLMNGFQNSGNISVVWSGMTNQEQEASSGIYFCKIKANNKIAVKKLVLQK
ncbi:MAG: T9SS type A sorting domain-containing protein [candidate division Zixibacteria bacterium]|nr:T9SS type A sorting domain-containing protein [candidate division Zixibacteria bacterium]